MTEDKYEDTAVQGTNRYVPLLVYLLTALVFLVIPLKIIGYGYLPVDDALADAAKAINGKPWAEILVLNNPTAIDVHIGWHTFLQGIFHWTNCHAETLVLFSVVGLFVLFGWSALPWLRRPEAWLIAFILVPGIGGQFMGRFMLGRPFMISMSVLVTLLFLWRAQGSSPPGKISIAAMTGLIALAVLLHGVWYFWALVIAAFILARQFRWAGALTASWIAGTLLGAALTGHPIKYISEAIFLAFGVLGKHATQRTLVSEFQPTPGNMFGLMLLGGLLVLRQLARIKTHPWKTNPAFWLVCIGWTLGYKAARFWEDWGLPALMVLMAFDLEPFLEERLPWRSLQRLAVTAGLAIAAFLATTNDIDSRWTSNIAAQYLTQDNPAVEGWLPDKGGIFYCTDMAFFYQTFFKNPNAPWRYMVGFEPALMPEEDFAIYQKILWNNGSPEAYQPWVAKMHPEDRLVLHGSGGRPHLPELEWNYVAENVWIGRLPRNKPK